MVLLAQSQQAGPIRGILTPRLVRGVFHARAGGSWLASLRLTGVTELVAAPMHSPQFIAIQPDEETP